MIECWLGVPLSSKRNRHSKFSIGDLLSKAPDEDHNGKPGRAIYSLDSEKRRLENESIRVDVELKRDYGKKMYKILVGQISVMNFIFIMVGFGAFDFSDEALNLYVGGTLAEIFGLVFVIVRYLFRS